MVEKNTFASYNGKVYWKNTQTHKDKTKGRIWL